MVGSFIAFDSALTAISTITRKAKVESWSIVRSMPKAIDPQLAVVCRRSPSHKKEQRLAGTNEVANPRRNDDGPIVALRLGNETLDVRRQNYS